MHYFRAELDFVQMESAYSTNLKDHRIKPVSNQVRVFSEVRRLGQVNATPEDEKAEIGATIGKITVEELEEVRALKNPRLWCGGPWK